MWIPRTTYQAIQRGFVLRAVTCEHCGAEFAYALSRESLGEGTSLLFLDNAGAEERAVEEAAKKLEAMLADEVDPVPCPHCHLYQAKMVRHLRDGSYFWMTIAAILGVVATIIAGAVLLSLTQYDTVANSTKLVCGLVFITSGLGTLTLWMLRNRWARKYEPNSDDYLALRQSCAQPTMLKADLEKNGVDYLLAPVQKAHARSDWSDIQFRCWLRMAIGLGIAGIGVYFLIDKSGELIAGYTSSGWPKAKARVTAAFVNSKTEKQKNEFVTHYFPEIVYAYEVQGKELTGSRYRFEPVINRNQTEIQAIVRPFQPPADIDVYYNPSNPAVSVILPGISSVRTGALVLLTCMVLGGFGFFGYEILRYRRLQNNAAAAIE